MFISTYHSITVSVWITSSTIKYFHLGIEYFLFVSHGGIKERGSTCKFRNARSTFRNLHLYFPKRPSGAPLHTLSKLYDVPVGFEPPPLFWRWILLILRSPKGGCCSISDDLSCSGSSVFNNSMINTHVEFNPYIYTFSKLSCFGYEISVFDTQQGSIQSSRRSSRCNDE